MSLVQRVEDIFHDWKYPRKVVRLYQQTGQVVIILSEGNIGVDLELRKRMDLIFGKDNWKFNGDKLIIAESALGADDLSIFPPIAREGSQYSQPTDSRAHYNYHQRRQSVPVKVRLAQLVLGLAVLCLLVFVAFMAFGS